MRAKISIIDPSITGGFAIVMLATIGILVVVLGRSLTVESDDSADAKAIYQVVIDNTARFGDYAIVDETAVVIFHGGDWVPEEYRTAFDDMMSKQWYSFDLRPTLSDRHPMIARADIPRIWRRAFKVELSPIGYDRQNSIAAVARRYERGDELFFLGNVDGTWEIIDRWKLGCVYGIFFQRDSPLLPIAK